MARLLREAGHEIIELERYSQSNKIWATKVKRLRVPDLLCLRCGCRIESRAKGDLKLHMSHAGNNPDRAWDKGLRDDDLVVFIRCKVTDEMDWEAAEVMAPFRVGDLRGTEKLARVSKMKAASEGSEVYLTWPASVASGDGTVLTVTADKVTVQFPSRKQTYPLVRRQRNGELLRAYPHVQPNDAVVAGTTVIASVLPKMAPVRCPATTPYDFVADLAAPDRETVYAAVKALGFLPELRQQSVCLLKESRANHADRLVRLEAVAALARLSDADGWAGLGAVLSTPDSETDLRMEACLILGELSSPRAVELLSEIAEGGDHTDFRSAAVWGLGNLGAPLSATPLLKLVSDKVEEVATHAIVTVTRLLTDDNLTLALDQIGPDAEQSAAIVRAVRDSQIEFVPEVVRRIQKGSPERQWLVYLLASAGRERSEAYLKQQEPKLLPELDFFWRFHSENWTSRVDISDQLEFLADQVLD